MRQFLYRIQPVRPEMLTEGRTELESQVISEHFSYLKALMEQGIVMMAGRTENSDHSSFGLVIFKAESEKLAREIMHDDPAVKKRVMRAELYPYHIAIFKPENAIPDASD